MPKIAPLKTAPSNSFSLNNASPNSMICSILIVVFGALFISALLTPPVFSTIIFFFPNFPQPFSRVFDRVAMVVILMLVIMLRRSFDLERLKLYFKGLKFPNEIRQGLLGFGITLLLSFLMTPIITGNGILVWDSKPFTYYVQKLLFLIPTAILISFIEETFFRLLLFRNLKSRSPLVIAYLLTSIVYAFAHVIAPQKSYVYPGYSLFGGLEYLWLVAGKLFQPEIAFIFFGLFLVGMVLAYAFDKTESLFLCIGLHAGWIVAVKMCTYLAHFGEGVTFSTSIGKRYVLVSNPLGWISVLSVVLVLALYFRFFGRSKKDIG